MTAALRMLGLDRTRWAAVGPSSVWPGTGTAVAASSLIAFNRFGGVIVNAPRSFVRLTLIGVWGWLGLALGVWIVAARAAAISTSGGDPADRASLVHVLALVGIAHTPILVLGAIIFVAAGLFEILGPGMATAWFVFAFWFPGGLVTVAGQAYDLSVVRAVAVVAVPYGIWLFVVGRHLLGQVQHLL